MTKPLYFWNGTTFELVGPTTPQSPFAYQTSAPTAPATGDIWIDSDGDVDTYNRQLTRYYFVASAGQTSVSGTDANGLTLAYVAGSETVYVNGALQVRGVDYTATNGTSITGLSALALNDVVEVFAYTAFTVANAYTKSETDSIAAAAPGLRMVVPTSVAAGSGTASVDAIGNITFTSVSSLGINGCFTSTYDNYKIIVDVTGSAATTVNYRLRLSGTDATASNYTTQEIYNSSATAVATYRALNTAQWQIVGNLTTRSMIEIELYSPKLALPTGGLHRFVQPTDAAFASVASMGHTLSTSYDGISFYPSSGTITGTIRIYGYKD